MITDEFKQPDDWYKFNGGDYESIEDLLQVGVLGFCGCGSPKENLEYIRRGLELINDPQPESVGRWGVWDAWWAVHKEKVLEHFGNDRSAYFFYYWAHRYDLTEHGGSVPGWLTDKGKKFLAALNENRAASSG